MSLIFRNQRLVYTQSGFVNRICRPICCCILIPYGVKLKGWLEQEVERKKDLLWFDIFVIIYSFTVIAQFLFIYRFITR